MDVGGATKAASDAGVGVLSGLASVTGLLQGQPGVAAMAAVILFVDVGSKAYRRIQSSRTERERAVNRGKIDDRLREDFARTLLKQAKQGNHEARQLLAKFLNDPEGEK